LNADVDAPTRDLLEKLGALWGLKRGKVIRELGRIALGQRPPLTAAERQALEIIALPPRPDRRPRPETAAR
jgi:hypothetical protein